MKLSQNTSKTCEKGKAGYLEPQNSGRFVSNCRWSAILGLRYVLTAQRLRTLVQPIDFRSTSRRIRTSTALSNLAVFIALTLSFIGAASADVVASQLGGWGLPSSSVSQLEQDCNAGLLEACNAVGSKYLRGEGVAKDGFRAADFYQSACDRGNARACYHLGGQYLTGDGVPLDETRAVPLIERACNGDIYEACYQLGLMYEHGKGVGKDYSRTGPLYKRACDGGDPDGCYMRGFLFEKGRGVVRDYPTASVFYERSCYAGVPKACHNLGWMFGQGRGLTRSEPNALKFFEKACAQGYLESCHNVGLIYTWDFDELIDVSRGIDMLRRNCDEFFIESCVALGAASEYGLGVEKDLSAAFSQYLQACQAGYGRSCYLFALLPYRTALGWLGFDVTPVKWSDIPQEEPFGDLIVGGVGLDYRIVRFAELGNETHLVRNYFIAIEDIEVDRKEHLATVIRAAREIQAETGAAEVGVSLAPHEDLAGGGNVLASARFVADRSWSGGGFEGPTWKLTLSGTSPQKEELDYYLEFARQRLQIANEKNHITRDEYLELETRVRASLGLPGEYVPWRSSAVPVRVPGLNWDLVSGRD